MAHRREIFVPGYCSLMQMGESDSPGLAYGLIASRQGDVGQMVKAVKTGIISQEDLTAPDGAILTIASSV
jgi:hypothetical protein